MHQKYLCLLQTLTPKLISYKSIEFDSIMIQLGFLLSSGLQDFSEYSNPS